MARADQALDALKYQMLQFGTHIKATYSSADDLTGVPVFHIEPFDENEVSSFSPTLSKSNYSFIITRFTANQTPDYPVGYLRQRFEADIIVVRKSLKTLDRTNDRNLIQFGGTDGQSVDVTSIERICTDLQKWFRNISQGEKLPNSSGTYMAFKSDIEEIGEFTKTGDFYFKVCKFSALSMESTTIS